MLSVQSEKDSLLKRPPLNATLSIDDGKPELAAAASLRRPQSSTRPRAPRLAPILIVTCLFALVGSALTYGLLPDISSASGRSPVASSAPFRIRETCPSQPAGRIADRSQWPTSHTKAELRQAADRLARAIRIPTESFEDLGPLGEDARWETRDDFLYYLQDEFPEVYETLDSEVVNRYGSLLTWKGKDKTLAPVLLMAHQDVVPVNQATIGRWDFPPFEGHLTELSEQGWIYGRGSRDCKNLVGIMTAIQRLIGEGFRQPERTIILAFGFDEELGGAQGAGHIHEVLLERYGPDSFAFVFDEGSQGIDTDFGMQIASLAMTEKGNAPFKIEIDTTGGHASVPPKHTGLGYLSLLLAHLEAHPVQPKFTASHPLMRYYQCLAEHNPAMPADFRRLVEGDEHDWAALAQRLADESDMLRSFLATSRAVDVVHGGSKTNALPENAFALIDSRLGFEDTVEQYHADLTALLLPIIKPLNLTFNAFGDRVFTPEVMSLGNVTLSGEGRNPPPITTSDGKTWAFMASLVRGVFGEETLVTPKAMLGATDGSKMQDLTKHLYRFLPAKFSEALNAHATNEKITLGAHLTTTRFFYEMIGNLEGWRAE